METGISAHAQPTTWQSFSRKIKGIDTEWTYCSYLYYVGGSKRICSQEIHISHRKRTSLNTLTYYHKSFWEQFEGHQLDSILSVIIIVKDKTTFAHLYRWIIVFFEGDISHTFIYMYVYTYTRICMYMYVYMYKRIRL